MPIVRLRIRLVTQNQFHQDLCLSFPDTGCVIGRSSRALSLEDPKCSRKHARLWLENGRLWVCDLHSRNGTFVEDERIAMQILNEGQSIRIGDTVIEIRELDTGIYQIETLYSEECD